MTSEWKGEKNSPPNLGTNSIDIADKELGGRSTGKKVPKNIVDVTYGGGPLGQTDQEAG